MKNIQFGSFTIAEIANLYIMIGGMIGMRKGGMNDTPNNTALLKLFQLLNDSLPPSAREQCEMQLEKIMSLVEENTVTKNLFSMTTDSLISAYKEKYE